MKKQAIRNAILQPAYDGLRGHLSDYKNRASGTLSSVFWENLTTLKQNFVRQNDQLSATAAWCLEAIGKIQDSYITVLCHLRNEKFKDAWELLEQCEIGVGDLDKHFIEENGEFGIEHVRVHASQIQELFFLKWGFSPGFLIKKSFCSICNAQLSIRTDCGHIIGDIYNGEMCRRIITEAKMLHVSIVDSPAQKHSVFWPESEGIRRFAPLTFLSDKLASPWDKWNYHKEDRKLHHPAFRNVGRNDRCPCNSNLKYKRCCLNKERIPEFPHIEFTFSGSVRGDLGRFEVHL